ncbi:MAG: class I SAM-dependent methyltransferase family protein [Thermoguttaceae bacterium]
MAIDSTNVTRRHTEAVERFLAEDVAHFVRRLAEIALEVKDHATPDSEEHRRRVDAAIDQMRVACRQLEDLIGENAEALRETREALREAIAPWFDQSYTMERAKTKPRGYPGDYIMLLGVYDGVPRSPGLGGYLDAYFMQAELARAVRGRMRAVREFLVEELSRRDGDVSIVDIACGPCREFVGGLECPPNVRPRITVVDSDQEALDYVAGSVSGIGGAPKLHCLRHNALRVGSVRRNIEAFGRPDILYSVGLFDYIPDRFLVPMLQGLRDTLAEGGVLYLAFKDCERYDKTVYQWMVDWFFFQRTADECRELFRQAGFDSDAMEMTRDESGIIVNFIHRSPTGERYRLDGAQATPEPVKKGGLLEETSSQQD